MRDERSMNMNNLQVFENTEFGKIRALEINGEPWFVGKDVADVLGYSNSRDALSKHVDEEDKNTVAFHDGNKGNPNQTIINESGLYSLILSSKLPGAKKFKRWVTSEILPSIRKTGGYQIPQSPMDALKLMVQVAEENRQMIQAVDNDLQQFKQDMPILGIEESKITNAVKRKGLDCLGGKDTPAYANKSLRGKIYADIYSQLKREFGVSSYKAIKRNQSDRAIRIIRAYKMPYILMDQIVRANAQLKI